MKSDDWALRKIQLVELEILNVISDFCEKRGITWFIDSGTCLGALRHGGFIPWDDDIDIGMMRDDYDAFCEAAACGLPSGYSLHTPLNTSNYAPLFAKVYKDGTLFENEETRASGTRMGIFVDVFPYDQLVSDKVQRRRQIRNARLSQMRSYLYHSNVINVPHKGLVGRVERCGCAGVHYMERLINRDPAKYIRDFSASIPNKDRNDPSLSDEYISLPWPDIEPLSYDELMPPRLVSFEDKLYPAPHKAEIYLTKVYGDWRQVPPEDERHTHLPILVDFGNGDVWRRDARP